MSERSTTCGTYYGDTNWVTCPRCGMAYMLSQIHNCTSWMWPIQPQYPGSPSVTVTTGIAQLTEDDVRRIVREELERVADKLRAGVPR